MASPDAAVEDWLAAVDAVDLPVLAVSVEPANIALLAGAENGFTVEQMTAVLEAGLPGATARSYWATFRESIIGFLGTGLEEAAVTGVERYRVGDISYAAVDVAKDGAETEVITRLGPDGWRIDLVATVGPALAVQLRRLVARIVAEADGRTARTYAATAVASLQAALMRDPGNRALELELAEVEDLPIDLGG